jgi:hypothetical protein
MIRPVLCSSLLLAVVLVTGCDFSSTPKVTLHPLTGSVTRDGKPMTEGGLIFIPQSGSWGGMVVNAAVSKDGTYTATTSRTTGQATTIENGAPVGTYKVVYHPPSDGQKMGLESELPDTIEVKAESNVINLALPIKIPEGLGQQRDDHN